MGRQESITAGAKVTGVWGSATIKTEDEIRKDDIVTEVDTPQSEWYVVTRTTAKSYWVSPQDDSGVEVRFAINSRRVILVLDQVEVSA